MSASYPTSAKSFTTKVDLVDDVMAVDINGLQDEVVALQTDLLANYKVRNATLTGWVSPLGAWTYVAANQFSEPGDVRWQFLFGTRISLTQTTAKYFVVTAVSFGAGVTTVTVNGGSDFTIANAAITLPMWSQFHSPVGWPYWFNFTCTMNGSGGTAGTFAEGSAYAKFGLVGRLCTIFIRKQVTNVGSWSGNVQLSYPINAVGSTGAKIGPPCHWANAAAANAPKGVLALQDGTVMGAYKTITNLTQWTDVVANDWFIINASYQV